jgi:NUMOD3 motif
MDAINKKYFYVYYSYEPWGRGYIGKRECWCYPEEDVKYLGSYSDKTFKPTEKIILQTFDTVEEAFLVEIQLQEFYQVDKNPHFANIYIHRSKNFCNNGSKIIRDKISKALTGIKRSEETKKKVSESKKGTIVSEETKIKLKEKRKGRKPSLGISHSEEWKKNHSERMKENNPFKGKKHTEENKKLMSEKKKGKPAHNKGKPHSEETKNKISETRKKQYELKKSQQSGGN